MSTVRRAVAVAVLVTVVASTARASTIAIGSDAFGPGASLTTFTGVPFGTEVNGLIVDGITFSYSLGNGHLLIGVGPGVTNNVSPPAIVQSLGPTGGILTLAFPSPISSFGFGWGIMAGGVVANATTIAIFDGGAPLGSLSYGGGPDPNSAGGFAGIESTTPFDRADVAFNPAVVPSFALDNIRTATVPEPGCLLLFGSGIALIARYGRRAGITSNRPVDN